MLSERRWQKITDFYRRHQIAFQKAISVEEKKVSIVDSLNLVSTL
jgi:hypothetical protein